MNIYSNYNIPNKTVLCDNKDPPWMANGIRAVIEMKNNAFKEYIRSGMRHNHYVCLENLPTELSNLIRDTKTEYHSKLAAKLVNPSTSAKTYWSTLKTFSKFQWYRRYSSIMNLFLILRLKLIISTGCLTNNVQQFPRIALCLPLSILQQIKL